MIFRGWYCAVRSEFSCVFLHIYVVRFILWRCICRSWYLNIFFLSPILETGEINETLVSEFSISYSRSLRFIIKWHIMIWPARKYSCLIFLLSLLFLNKFFHRQYILHVWSFRNIRSKMRMAGYAQTAEYLRHLTRLALWRQHPQFAYLTIF